MTANEITKENDNDLKLVLASSSPRREEILKQLKLKFTIVPSKINEENFTEDDPISLVRKLAVEKAKSVSNLVENALIIAADTVVVYDNQILGKPKNKSDARRMLKMLRAKKHQVITGVAVVNSQDGEVHVDENITEVKMADLTDTEIDTYIETGEPMDKAGSYAIQGFGALFVEEIQGSFYSVMGLPIHQLAKLLNNFDYGIL